MTRINNLLNKPARGSSVASKTADHDTFQYLATAIRIIMYFRPLRVFLPASVALFLFAVAKGGMNIVNSPSGLHDSDILISLVALMVQSVGMLGDLVVAQPPQY